MLGDYPVDVMLLAAWFTDPHHNSIGLLQLKEPLSDDLAATSEVPRQG